MDLQSMEWSTFMELYERIGPPTTPNTAEPGMEWSTFVNLIEPHDISESYLPGDVEIYLRKSMAVELDDSGRWPRLSNDADDPSEIPDPGDHDLDDDTEYSRFPSADGGDLSGDFGFDPMVRAGMIRCVQLSFVMAGTLSNLLVRAWRLLRGHSLFAVSVPAVGADHALALPIVAAMIAGLCYCVESASVFAGVRSSAVSGLQTWLSWLYFRAST
jgi:hypothetical protein